MRVADAELIFARPNDGQQVTNGCLRGDGCNCFHLPDPTADYKADGKPAAGAWRETADTQ